MYVIYRIRPTPIACIGIVYYRITPKDRQQPLIGQLALRVCLQDHVASRQAFTGAAGQVTGCLRRIHVTFSASPTHPDQLTSAKASLSR